MAENHIRNHDDAIGNLLAEAWDKFHLVILKWVKNEAKNHPSQAVMVYKALLSGPQAAVHLASRLKTELDRQK